MSAVPEGVLLCRSGLMENGVRSEKNLENVYLLKEV